MKRNFAQMDLFGPGPRTPYQAWHDDYHAGTWVDFLDWVLWVPGEILGWK